MPQFTLHKIVSQMLKQLQIILVEETSRKLLELYLYERHHTTLGAMSESTYRNNARLLLEGDDCFHIEQMYCDGTGELVMAFLPEKEAEEHDDDDDDEDDEEVPARPPACLPLARPTKAHDPLASRTAIIALPGNT